MLMSLPEIPTVAFGTPSVTLAKGDISLIAQVASTDPEVAEAHLISFRELHLMKSSGLTVALITKAGSVADEVARRVHKTIVKKAPDLDRVTLIGLPIDHRLVNPIRCVRGQIFFDYGKN